ncbi:SRPBCC family protein [Streptomyces sp. gb14]|uniref:SRPBCC family protein n=1 Tax=Streptomyces sp. gb14 TaxID=1827753 RepID=UPI000BF08E90|nr:SRPBCC family protein [Streptomyces sp. gb14]
MNGQIDASLRTRELTASITIAAPPEKVFGALSDVRRMPEWSPECVEVWVMPGRSAPGLFFIGFNRNGARRWATLCRVTKSEAPREFTFRVSVLGLPVALWGFRIYPVHGADQGSAQVVQYWKDLRRGRRGRITDLLGQVGAGTSPAARVLTNRLGMTATLYQLKRSLEGSS